MQDEIIEVDGVIGLHLLEDQVVDIQRARYIVGAGNGVRQQEEVLPAADLPTDALGLIDVPFGTAMLDQLLDQHQTVVLVEDRDGLLETQGSMFLTNDIQTQGMKGRDRQAADGFVIHQFAYAAFHFASGLVGEGDGGDVAGG